MGTAIAGKRYIYNAGFCDLEGDSLSYELAVPLQGSNISVPNYRFPNELSDSTQSGATPATFAIDSVNGFVYWDAPTTAGEYNIAFKVNEWRDGRRIGSYTRDMQVLVQSCESGECNPPVFDISLWNRVVLTAGDMLDFNFKIAQHGQTTSLAAYSSHLQQENISFSSSETSTTNNGKLTWNTKLDEIRLTPYNFYFFAKTERSDGEAEAFSMSLLQVFLRTAKPLNLTATANDSEKSVALSWSAYQNGNLSSYSLFRRVSKIDNISEDSSVDISWLNQYVKIAELGKESTNYTDLNLVGTSEYSYRLVANLEIEGRQAKSLASNRATATITCSTEDVVADFQVFQNGKDVFIVNNSQNAHTYYWDFGDGTKDTTFLNQIAHTYQELDEYQISLTATNSCNTQSVTKNTIITSLEIESGIQLNIYPNPATGGSHLKLDMPKGVKIISSSLFSQDGKKYKLELKEDSLKLPEGIAPSLYFMVLELGSGETIVEKLVIE